MFSPIYFLPPQLTAPASPRMTWCMGQLLYIENCKGKLSIVKISKAPVSLLMDELDEFHKKRRGIYHRGVLLGTAVKTGK